jgi:hypothetical protein
VIRPNSRQQAQWWTSSRLLRLGEPIDFRFHLPAGASTRPLHLFGRYLEQAQPGDAFAAGGDLAWLDTVPSETVDLEFAGNTASFAYTPPEPGNYLARWGTADESLYRYFSVVEHDWIVLRFSTFGPLESEPTLHGTGIPLDYRLSAAQFDADDPLFQTMLGHSRSYGDGLIPFLPDMPSTFSVSDEERDKLYAHLITKARSVMPFADDIRSARVEMNHPVDPGYTTTLSRLGIHDHCGLQEANAEPWLGMPEFPYFSSEGDCRKPSQKAKGQIVAHQWDFCGGFHFTGPVSWHFKVAEGDWAKAEQCLRHGMEEFEHLAAMSGHPAFVHPLYDGVLPPGYPDDGVLDAGYPNPSFRYDLADHGTGSMHAFVQRYQQFMAFEMPKAHKVVFARSIDVADYYIRHFEKTPRTVFVSRTDHIDYDKWWLCTWCNESRLVPGGELPWDTPISPLHAKRDASQRMFKDPLSCEYIQVEDAKRSMRFEYACPHPIWWFDYTEEERVPQGSTITATMTPDVQITRSEWTRTNDEWSLTLKMHSAVTFADYAIALWDMPDGIDGNTESVRSDAKECIVAWNRIGAHRLILVFDLVPEMELHVTITADS